VNEYYDRIDKTGRILKNAFQILSFCQKFIFENPF